MPRPIVTMPAQLEFIQGAEQFESSERLVIPTPESFFAWEHDRSASSGHPDNYNLGRYVGFITILNAVGELGPLDGIEDPHSVLEQSASTTHEHVIIPDDAFEPILRLSLTSTKKGKRITLHNVCYPNTSDTIQEFFKQDTTIARAPGQIPTFYKNASLEAPTPVEIMHASEQDKHYDARATYGKRILGVANEIAQLLGACFDQGAVAGRRTFDV